MVITSDGCPVCEAGEESQEYKGTTSLDDYDEHQFFCTSCEEVYFMVSCFNFKPEKHVCNIPPMEP